MSDPETLLFIILGAILVLAGRRIYKLTVGVFGFVGGWYLAWILAPGLVGWQQYVIALLCGIGGVVAAHFATAAAWVVGGFFAGGYGLAAAASRFSLGDAGAGYFIGGGIAGAILIFFLMDWGIVAASSSLGAFLIVDNTIGGGWAAYAVFFLIAAAGVVFQARSLREKK
jgi:hypothetical protein